MMRRLGPCRALLLPGAGQVPALQWSHGVREQSRSPKGSLTPARAGRWCVWSLVSLSMLAGNVFENAGGGPPVEVEKKFELQGGAEERVAKSGLAYVGGC